MPKPIDSQLLRRQGQAAMAPFKIERVRSPAFTHSRIAFMTGKESIRELAAYALAKTGAQLQFGGELTDENSLYACVKLARVSWGEFFDVHREGERYFAKLPVVLDRLAEHQRMYPAIHQTPQWRPRDGHVQMTVPLRADVPVNSLKAFIDEAYDIVWHKLDDNGRLMIELAGARSNERELMDRLIDFHDLSNSRQAIHDLARRAILLRTKMTSESDIAIGASKIGGMPDLPINTRWPVHENGKPLAFLAQMDLADIATHGTIIEGLPTEGLLSVFSVWGWTADDDFDPQIPNDGYDDQQGWSVFLHSPPGQELARRDAPQGVNSFKAGSVEPILILSLPNDRLEPELAALNWTDDEYDRFDFGLQLDFHSIQMSRYFKNMGSTSHHRIGGYAQFQQAFPGELLEVNSRMLLQIGTDFPIGMRWGDGGDVTFYADTGALREGRFEHIWATCQGG
jgi:uncharacterized protein YwqG